MGERLKASTRFEANHAFVLDEKDIKILWELLDKTCPVYEAKIHCSDEITRTYKDIKELLDYPNPKKSEIISLELYGASENGETTADILIASPYSKKLSFTLKGEERTIAALRADIINHFDGLRPWYSKLATFDSFILWMIIFFSIIVGGKLLNPEATIPKLSGSQVIATLLLSAIACGLLYTLANLIGKIAKYCFPIASFAIGQGSKRHAVAENIRWSVLVCFVVSAAVSSLFLYIQ